MQYLIHLETFVLWGFDLQQYICKINNIVGIFFALTAEKYNLRQQIFFTNSLFFASSFWICFDDDFSSEIFLFDLK